MLQSKQQIGKLDKRITFQRKDIGTNESNEDVEAGWDNVVTVWAEVNERRGSESYQGDQLVANTTAAFTIRHRSGLDEEMRITYNGRKYDIQAILYESRKGYIEILAESGGKYVESEVGGFSSGYSNGYDT